MKYKKKTKAPLTEKQKKRANEALQKSREYTRMREEADERRRARREALQQRVKNYTLEYLKSREPHAKTPSSRHWFSKEITQRIKAERRKRREERKKFKGEHGDDKELPEHLQPGHTRTVENQKKEDPCKMENCEEIQESLAADEFAKYFDRSVKPLLMVTTCQKPCTRLLKFITELQLVIPSFYYFPRRTTRVKSIVEFAKKHEYTDLLVFTQSRKEPYGVWISHLPHGPTSFFRLTSLKLIRDIRNSGDITDHAPEVMFNNFESHVGVRAMRQLMSLFPQDPEFRGRRVITFHNQRDFIFFRHHRYIFAANGERTRLQEIGPRFTLKLHSLHRGTFDPKEGVYEYFWTAKMNEDRTASYM